MNLLTLGQLCIFALAVDIWGLPTDRGPSPRFFTISKPPLKTLPHLDGSGA